ncbi:hypothetical protein PR003_g25760 [Phytophthora rubi]|uniref:Secreted protein n=2 Tax=Phytophthora rubi TaxID=129364 RepID=A0A6A4CHY0_9STRA|nr:hypothetical protein PR002_g24830 [Phytophthora rubi]KAE9288629.1 hypothetical protein PR003_g25760 [Phytophthora rubi]
MVPNVAWAPLLVLLVDVCVAFEPSCVADWAVVEEDAVDCPVVDDDAVSAEEAVDEVCVTRDEAWSTFPLLPLDVVGVVVGCDQP